MTIPLMVAGLVALLVIVATTFLLVARTQDFARILTEARQTRNAAIDLRGFVQEAETGQRGFLLTENAEYLRPYERAVGRISKRLSDLEALGGARAETAAPVRRLRTIIEGKLAELKQTIDLQQGGRRVEAIALVNTDVGQALMDEARSLFDDVIGRTESRIADTAREQNAGVAWLWWVTLWGALAVLLVVGGCAALVIAYTHRLLATEAEIRHFNTGLEERVNERTAELSRANDEIQRFAYIVTHDLRAPLVNIMGFTSELETSLATIRAYVEGVATASADPNVKEVLTATQEDAPESLGFIRMSTKKMDGLITAILKLSREGRRTLKPERVDLGELLAGCATSIRHQIDAAEGEVSIDARGVSVFSDRLALEQIFGNLLDNAFKYRSPDRPPRIAIRALAGKKGRVAVEVTDNGRGIAPQDHERVFELFRRSGRQDQPGEGIGLAHVRALARSLGADVRMRSELGQGTTFGVDLPRDLPVAERSLAA